MAQHMQINTCNTVCKQNQGQKPHDHLGMQKKSLVKIQYPFMIKIVKKRVIEGM
jgi:hypothetical protein